MVGSAIKALRSQKLIFYFSQEDEYTQKELCLILVKSTFSNMLSIDSVTTPCPFGGS